MKFWVLRIKVMKTIIKNITLIVFLFGAQNTYCQNVGADTVYYRSGFSSRVFINVNQNDALALTKILTENVVRESSLSVKSTTPHFFENFDDIDKSILEEKDDLYILLSTEYLSLKNNHLLEPIVVANRNISVYDVYQLIVKKESGIKSLGDLKGKKIIIGESREGDIAHHWLDNLLSKSNLEVKEKFFGEIKILEKSLPALLPVFFGTADACIVTENLVRTAYEMNPQLESELTSIDKSKPLLIAILANRKTLPVELKKELTNGLLELDKTTDGKQILTLFRINGLKPFKIEYLKNVSELIKMENSK